MQLVSVSAQVTNALPHRLRIRTRSAFHGLQGILECIQLLVVPLRQLGHFFVTPLLLQLLRFRLLLKGELQFGQALLQHWHNL